MSFPMVVQSTNPIPHASRGRVDKRQAILEAALEVFAESGYSQASVDFIAAKAGVAKPTIYNHFGDKEQLFRAVILEFGAQVSETNIRAIEQLSIRPKDLRAELEQLGRRLNGCFDDPRSRAIYRLMVAEIIHFPDLIDEWQRTGPDRLTEALAGRFAILAGSGYLRQDEAICTATQFIGLISNQFAAMSAFGTCGVSEEEYEGTIRSGVDTFIRAFGTEKSTTA
jgi:AcrR family transcriptional regulator